MIQSLQTSSGTLNREINTETPTTQRINIPTIPQVHTSCCLFVTESMRNKGNPGEIIEIICQS